MSDDKNIEKIVIENPWRNVYWFSRMLINGDKYGAIGKESKLLVDLAINLRKIINDNDISTEAKVILSKKIIHRMINERFLKANSRIDRVNLFIEDLKTKIQSIDDVKVFILTAESILVPINKALDEIPSDDKQFTITLAKAYFDEFGDSALAKVINLWDDAGVEGCLTAERVSVVREFTNLKKDILFLPEYETNVVLTSFVQEFERRLGQKRKARAGGSLEDVTSFILDYFNIKADKEPEHFQADIEVDKWVKCSNKWLIGISCKRTLRERWKQVSSATAEVLSRYKIRQIWHLVTYDEDLSDDKLSLLGGLRHIFYLSDDSRRFMECKNNIGLKDYVRPMSDFIDDLQKEIKK